MLASVAVPVVNNQLTECKRAMVRFEMPRA